MSLLSPSNRVESLPPIAGEELLRRLERDNILGRGGAGFPVARKWRTVRQNGRGHAVLVANGAEGEPLSHKDATLMAQRPHLVIEGALLAAQTVGARELFFYIGAEHREAVSSISRALAERPEHAARKARVVQAPPGYVSGEESAAVHFINAGDARPTTTPPRPFEHGVSGRPTLVQNVESLAIAALLARGEHDGTALMTASGAVYRPGVVEVSLDATVAEIANATGGIRSEVQAVLMGGYFGSWAQIGDVWSSTVNPSSLRARGLTFGCGVAYFLPAERCGVAATARIIGDLASQSARQCGPCVFGLGAIAAAARRLADRAPQADDLKRLSRWSGQLAGRGACKHPDGATGMLRSALQVFAQDFAAHQQRRCLVTPLVRRQPFEAIPQEAVA